MYYIINGLETVSRIIYKNMEKIMELRIGKKATKGYLFKFALPTIVSMVLMGLFGLIDGIFVSRVIDPIALAAVGIVWPFVGFFMAIGLMLGTGGNALVAKKLGEGHITEARKNFSFINFVALIISVVMSVIGLLFPVFILNILGADDSVRSMALQYLKPLLYFIPVIVLGTMFQQFLITEGKAHYLTISTIVGGIINIILNYLLIYVLQMGLTGAALATSIGYTVPVIIGVACFTFKRNGVLFFVKPNFSFGVLIKSITNGSSEMIAMLASSLTSVLMNNVLMRIQGADAVAASSVIFGGGLGIVVPILMGYASGIAPIISYNFGKGDINNLKRVYANSMGIMWIISIFSIVAAWIIISPILRIYDIPASSPIYEMSIWGARIISVSFLFMSFNTFASMMFTALNNGKLSALLSLFRTLIFVVISFLILPELFGVNGAWAALPFAELLGLGMTIYFLKKMKRVYKYA